MAHTNPSNEELRKLLTKARTIAIVGASSTPEKPSHGIMRQLLNAGYVVIPVNPRETEVLGQKGRRARQRCGCSSASRTKTRPPAQERAASPLS